MSVLSRGVRNGAAAAGSTGTTFDDVRDVITYQLRDELQPLNGTARCTGLCGRNSS